MHESSPIASSTSDCRQHLALSLVIGAIAQTYVEMNKQSIELWYVWLLRRKNMSNAFVDERFRNDG